MPDSVGWVFFAPPEAARVPEVVEVVYCPVLQSTLLYEVGRVKCEVEEAIDALDAWMARYHLAHLDDKGYLLPGIAAESALLGHVRQHLCWALDPTAE